MKKCSYLFFILLTSLAFSCADNEDYVNYLVNEAVYMPANQFRNSVKVTHPEPIKEQGKICFYEGFLFISEPEKGIHVIDNRDPKSPQNVAYIELLGNAELSVRNNVLYADSYIDLVWFDITSPENPKLKGRLENAFPMILPICDNNYGYDYESIFGAGKPEGIIVGWTLKEKRYKVEKYDGDLYYGAANSGSTGKTGSMSRFAIYQDYLYAVIDNQLHIMDIKNTEPVQAGEPIYVGWNAETIFSYKDCMFFGTPTGMLIYSVADPLSPTFQSSLSHVYGCDPVVVEDDLAYVTIWAGNTCGQSANELFIVDVSDVKNPKQIVSYGMNSPKGLGIDNKTLFVCDDGLKIYNAADPQKIMSNVLGHYKGMQGFDVIPANNILMMIAEDGLYQYDYSDLKNIKELSKLSISK